MGYPFFDATKRSLPTASMSIDGLTMLQVILRAYHKEHYDLVQKLLEHGNQRGIDYGNCLVSPETTLKNLVWENRYDGSDGHLNILKYFDLLTLFRSEVDREVARIEVACAAAACGS